MKRTVNDINGKFTDNEVKKIKQSVRKKSRDWRFIKKNLTHFNKKIIVSELGCGTGSTAILSKTVPNIKLYNAIDNSKEILKFVEIENILYVKTLKLDLEKDKLPKSDVFIAKYLFHHVNNKERLICEICSKLNSEGKVVIIDKFPRWNIFKTSILIEKMYHILRIKRILGKHYYSTESEFETLVKSNNLKITEKQTRTGKKVKNFFMKINYYTIEKS